MANPARPYPKDEQLGRWVCRAGSETCTRAAKCRSCQGRANRRKGQRKQREAARELGIPPAKFRGTNANEEHWRGMWRVECKAGYQVKGLATRFLDAEAQSFANKATGDARPFLMVAMPDSWGAEGLVVVRLSDWRDHVAPVLEERP